MMKKVTLLIVVFCAFLFASEAKIVSYFPYWLQYSQFTPENVRYKLLTDIHYGYIVPSGNGEIAFADDSDVPNFEKLVGFAKKEKIKIFVNIGGIGNEDAMKTVASDESACSAFAASIKNFIAKYGLDGVEVDWIPSENADFALVQKLISLLLNEDVVVSATVAGNEDQARLYSAELLNRLYSVSVMLTDQMNESVKTVVPNSDFSKDVDVLKAYAAAGVNKSLLIPVVPMYGKSLYKATGLNSAYEGVGSGNEGVLPYKDLMKIFDGPDYKVTFDSASHSEVAVSSSETIVFNGIPSFRFFAEQVAANGFGGIAVYDISGDDVHPVVSLLVTVGQVLRPEINYNGKRKK